MRLLGYGRIADAMTPFVVSALGMPAALSAGSPRPAAASSSPIRWLAP